ncbi:MAG: peptidoglycan DD-metalloendopeptidase family protein [Bacilli bacterium]
MNEIDKKKYMDIINKNKVSTEKKDNNFGKSVKKLFVKTLIVLLLFVSLAICCKRSEFLKEKITDYLYSDDISFTKIKNIYDKYLGGILPIKKEVNTEKVFNEKLEYSSSSVYLDGVKLEVTSNYLVPSLREGMVVFIGNKEGYGNTVIIEDLDGIYNWYGNIDNTSLKLYDYVDKGTLVGEVNNTLYLVFSKGDKYLNYEEYLK